MKRICIISFAFSVVLLAGGGAWAQNAAIDPNQPLNVARTNAPPPHEWRFSATTQEADGKVRKLHGHAEIEGNTVLFRADEIEYDEETGDLHASGNVFYQNFQKKERIWCDRMDYNTDSETGKFYKVHGQTQPRIDARPGILTTNNPFYFEGDWAERIEDKYILHDGFVTNCKMPSPWWTLRGPKFDIIPGERAIAYRSLFRIKKFPLFWAPFFYKSLQREPRKSGFLVPNIGNSSLRGIMLGVGYFWAINRSYDVTYRLQEFTSRGEAHNVDFRGKPWKGTDYDVSIYRVDDRVGELQPSGQYLKYSGMTLYGIGKSDLGNGWNLRFDVNYISSLRFRLDWTESFNEAIGSEIQSAAVLNKNWSSYTFDVVTERTQNYQNVEVAPINDPTHFQSDAITIHRLPEARLDSSERPLWKGIPVWFSFDSSAGLLYREQPYFDPTGVLVEKYQTGQFMNRVNFAPHVMTALNFHNFHLVPRIGVQETYYSESQTYDPVASQLLNSSIDRVIGTNLLRSSRDVSVDLIFPTLSRIYQKKSKFGDKVKHVIEPRITYNYVSGIGPEFARYIHFDDLDITSDTNELVLSLTNRVYAKRGDNVDEIFSWELAQARYFDPTFGGAVIPGQRNVVLASSMLTPYAFLFGDRTSSPVVSIMRASPYAGLSFDWRFDYDHTRGAIVNNTTAVDYRWKKYFVSGGHSLVHADPVLHAPANQLRFRAGFGNANSRGWGAALDGVYDFDQGPNFNQGILLYTTAQVTYNTNCCGLSVQIHRFNWFGRDEIQYRFAFSISNIASFGSLRKEDRLF